MGAALLPFAAETSRAVVEVATPFFWRAVNELEGRDGRNAWIGATNAREAAASEEIFMVDLKLLLTLDSFLMKI